MDDITKINKDLLIHPLIFMNAALFSVRVLDSLYSLQKVISKRILNSFNQETETHFLHSWPLVRCGTKLKFRSLFRSGARITQTKFILRDRFNIQSTYPASRHWDNQITL